MFSGARREATAPTRVIAEARAHPAGGEGSAINWKDTAQDCRRPAPVLWRVEGLGSGYRPGCHLSSCFEPFFGSAPE